MYNTEQHHFHSAVLSEIYRKYMYIKWKKLMTDITRLGEYSSKKMYSLCFELQIYVLYLICQKESSRYISTQEKW